MGNTHSQLLGIHPFKDESDSSGTRFIPPVQIKNLTLPELPPPQIQLSSQLSTASTAQPQQLSLAAGWSSITADPQPQKFDDLFVVKAPTPPPRRISYNEAGKPNRRIPKVGFLGRGFTSLRSLPRMIRRPDLGKIRGFFRRKRVTGEVYPVPPDAEKPSPPSKPEVFHEQDEYFLLRWDPPAYDGGLPIIGYIIQHLELGLPQPDQTIEKDDTQSWFSSEPGQVTSTEVLLNNLIPGTTYQFRIIAENLLGFSQPSDISTPIVFNPHGELDDWFCPPVIIIPLNESYTVIEHERLVLAVEITGQPYPIVKWYGGDGVELGKVLDPVKYTVVSCGQRRVLTINSVDCGDSGVVRCVGDNERGVVECSCVVVVEAPPHIRRVLRSDLIKLENPYELNKTEERQVRRQDENDEELIFQSGELARFKFLYSGSPAPNVCVYHEGDLVDGEEVVGSGRVFHERVQSEITDNLITVKIAGVKRSDRGEWTVRLDNVLGEDACTVLVTISDRPSEPGKPDVLQLSDNTVILKWDKPYDDGGCPVSGYVVEYFRSEWGVWLKACTTKNPYTKIRDLIPGSKYSFRVKAENLYGMSDPSVESVELLITDLASTLRSVGGGGDGEGTLLMTTVVEEEEDAVKIEEDEPGRRKQGSNISLNRVSSGTMTDLSALGKGKWGEGEGSGREQERGGDKEPDSTGPSHHINLLSPTPKKSTSPHPPRKTLRLESPTRSPSPSRLLKVNFQPQVVLPEDEDIFDEEDEDILLEPIRRSPSPHVIPAPPTPRRSPSPVAPPRSRTFIQQAAHVDEEAIALTRSQEFFGESSGGGVPVPPKRHQTQVQSQIQTQLQTQVQTQVAQQISPPSSHPPPQMIALQPQLPHPISRSPQAAQPSQPQLTPTPKYIPIVQPIEQPKKLYSRSEIIKSAATDDLDHYYSSLTEPNAEEEHVEEPEEDPELLKVKEALSKDDHLFDDLEDEEEDLEYEYDFDKLQEEYENDRRKGQVSRQDSGVSARSADHSGVSRGESLDEEDDGRRSVMSEVLPKKPMLRMGSFERAQSEVVHRDKPVFEFKSSEAIRVEEIPDEVELVPPPVEPRRTISPSPQRSFGGPPQRTGTQSQTGSRTMLHDRFTDYIAMKASSRNKKIGSSLRSLSSSRYSSNENVVSRDSGRSSMQTQDHGEGLKNYKQFTWREFDAQEECRAVKSLEKSSSVSGSAGLSIFRVSQQRGLEDRGDEVEGVMRGRSEGEEDRFSRFECAFISTPEIYSSERGDRGLVLEHSKSLSQVGVEEVPDSGLKEKIAVCHAPGGIEVGYVSEEGESGGVSGFTPISEEESGEAGGSGGREVDRDVPRDRGEGAGYRRLRKRVSFGSSDVEELSWDDGGRRGRVGGGNEGVEGGEELEGGEEHEGVEHEDEGDAGEGEYEGEEEYADEEQVERDEGEDEYQEGEEYEGEHEQYAEDEEHQYDEQDPNYNPKEQQYLLEYEDHYPDDTHPGDDEFEDDGEVFEMDIEGIDPRVYAEEDAEIEGEEDSSSGVMYVLLEPARSRDLLTEFEGGFTEGDDDNRVGDLLSKVDRFLEGEEGGGWIEEVGEEGEGGEMEAGGGEEKEGRESGENIEREDLEEEVEEDMERLLPEEQNEEQQDSEVIPVEEDSKMDVPVDAIVDLEPTNETDNVEVIECQETKPTDTESQLEPEVSESHNEALMSIQIKDSASRKKLEDEKESFLEPEVSHEEAVTNLQIIEDTAIKLEESKEVGTIDSDKLTDKVLQEVEATTPKYKPIQSELISDLPETNIELEDEHLEALEIISGQFELKLLNEAIQLPRESIQSTEEIESQIKSTEQIENLEADVMLEKDSSESDNLGLLEATQSPKDEELEKEPGGFQIVQDVPKAEQTDQNIPMEILVPLEPSHSTTKPPVQSIQSSPEVKLTDKKPESPAPVPSKRDIQTEPQRKAIQPPTTTATLQIKRDTPHHQPPKLNPTTSSEVIEPPPPPPRPRQFSYKTYMAERPQPVHRTHSREPSTRSSISSLPTVKEEQTSTPPQKLTYKPNMSIYFEKSRSTSIRSPSSSVSSSTQELFIPRVPFKSPSESEDPPVVSIEEIRARIEQNRLELLRQSRPMTPVEDPRKEEPVVKSLKVEEKLVEAPISPFMNYLFNAAFYLMLSPMLVFVDSLWFGLLSLLLIACVHFFIIRD